MATRSDPRTGNVYSIWDAAKLAELPYSTALRWLQGGIDYSPVFGAPRCLDGYTSFLELAELVVAAKFRKYGGKTSKIRRAHRVARLAWPDLEYPFASLRLRQLGGEIIHAADEEDPEGPALALSMDNRQWVLPGMVKEAMDLFDFDETSSGLARRWFPAGRNTPIVMDPRIAGGVITVEGTGVTLETLVRRVTAHEPIKFIAKDLGIPRRTIEEAIRHRAFAA